MADEKKNSKNASLTGAKNAKKDEFYTQIADIEKEMRNYEPHFRGKTVFCNCDDPRVSNFFKYFALNFKYLGLKRLITTCYKNTKPDLFSQNAETHGLSLDYDGSKFDDHWATENELDIKILEGNGDFRSPECVELLKQSDIVCTNPPFSLFREYVAQLVEHDKKFIIIGNQNAISYKEIFKLIKENKIWLGASIHSGDREFGVPDDYPLNAAGFRVDEDGNKFIRVKGVRWFTNLDYKERHDDLVLYKRYSPAEFPKYDNYDAINVDKTSEIPADYDGVIGVPITFLDKWNPEQFEILGVTQRNDDPYKIKKYTTAEYKNANDLNARATIMVNGVLKPMYARVLIRRKK